MKRGKMTAALLAAAVALALMGCQGQGGGDRGQTPQATADKTAGAKGGEITEQRAREIALAEAQGDARAVVVEKEREDGETVYEVSFYVQGTKYEVDVGGTDGRVKKSEQKAEQAGADKAALARDKAEALALSRVPGAGPQDIGLQYETDDGRTQYDGRIVYNGRVYEFEIDANSGDVLEWKEKAAA